MDVTRRASPPSGEITYTCGESSPARWLVKATSLPSGDHFGPPFLPVVLVNCFCVLPSVASSQRLEVLSSLSRLYLVTSTTHHCPSGEMEGAPTRWIFHRSSAVIGRAANADVAQA